MRSMILGFSLLLFGSLVFAHGTPKVNLDQPGVLDELKAQHPQRYQRVSALLRASEHAPCLGHDLEVLKTQFNVKDFECGMLVLTSYPAKRRVSFELEGVDYSATVVLKDADVLLPASTTEATSER